jgi:hypothetical protein
MLDPGNSVAKAAKRTEQSVPTPDHHLSDATVRYITSSGVLPNACLDVDRTFAMTLANN